MLLSIRIEHGNNKTNSTYTRCKMVRGEGKQEADVRKYICPRRRVLQRLKRTETACMSVDLSDDACGLVDMKE